MGLLRNPRKAGGWGGGKGAHSGESQPLEEGSKGERGGDPEEGGSRMYGGCRCGCRGVGRAREGAGDG